jgi:hypothetical protein
MKLGNGVQKFPKLTILVFNLLCLPYSSAKNKNSKTSTKKSKYAESPPFKFVKEDFNHNNIEYSLRESVSA